MNPRMKMIWFSIVMSTAIYCGVAFTLSGRPGELQQLAGGRSVPMFYGLALAMFVVGWFVVRRIVRGKEQTRMIVTLAVFESCAIFGLLGAFLTRDWRVYLFPWALALIGFIREFPRASAAEPPAGSAAETRAPL